MTDQRELIERFRNGDPDATRDVYRRHQHSVFQVAYSVTGNRETAADVTQLTFLKAWQAADRLQVDRAIAPWLHTIARRTAIDVHRHERRPTIGAHGAETDVAVTGPSMEQTWTANEVRAAVRELPPSTRDIVGLTHWGDLTHTDIADRLGLPLGTVKSRTTRARQRLAERLSHLHDGALVEAA